MKLSRPAPPLLRLSRFVALLAMGLVSARAQLTYTWSGGDFVTGSISPTPVPGGILAPTSTLNIVTGGNHDFGGSSLINNGIVNWSGPGTLIRGTGSVTNNGAWNDSAANGMVKDVPSPLTFTNSAGATYKKISGVTDFDIAFANAGILTVQGGTLNLNAGGNFSTGSTFGSTGTGMLQLTGGNLNINGTVTATNFVINGGTISGNKTFNVSTVSWQNGTLGGDFSTTVASASTLSILGSNNHDMGDHALINNGVINWSGTGSHIRSGGSGSITNNAIWNDSTTSEINNFFGGTNGFTNAAGATYIKNSGTTLFMVPLLNSGTVTVSGGTLSLMNGGTLENGSSIGSSGPGVAQLTAGLLTANGTISLPNFIFAGGQLDGVQTFNGIFRWVGANLNTVGTMTVGSGGILNIDLSADHDFNGHAIVNNGMVNWNAGRLRSGSGGSIVNNATWNDNASSELNNFYSGPTVTFTNTASGNYSKSSAGTTTFMVPFTNSGIIKVSAGILSLQGGFTNSNGSIALSNGTITSTSAITMGTGTLSGVGTINAASLSSAGAIIPGLPMSAGVITINGNLSLLSTAQPFFEIGGTTQGIQYDFLSVSGNVIVGGNLAFVFIGGFNTSVTGAMTFTLIGSTALTGAFANVANGARIMTSDGFGSFQVNYGSGSIFGSNNVVLSSYLTVPEPSTWALLICGVAFLALAARRRL